MASSDPGTSCYLVEWYLSGLAAVAPADAVEQLTRAAAEGDSFGQPVTLIMALSVPDDQTLFGVFRAATTDVVMQTCRRAGWPADRISTDVHPWLTPGRS